MFDFARKQQDDELDYQIKSVYKSMDEWGPDEEIYHDLVKHLGELKKLQRGSARRINSDVLMQTAGHLVGILIVVGWERTHVWTTKAVNPQLRAPQTDK